jgi:hypothetical protein
MSEEKFICDECGHGVAQHEWEDESISTCLVEGCQCAGYRKRHAAPAPQGAGKE